MSRNIKIGSKNVHKFMLIIGMGMIIFSISSAYFNYWVAPRLPVRHGTVIAETGGASSKVGSAKQTFFVKDDETGKVYRLELSYPYNAGDEIDFRVFGNSMTFGLRPDPVDTTVIIVFSIIGLLLGIAGYFKIDMSRHLRY